mmetsp:Transcript_30897/g.87452  ORF Transcript_30897/g.87452 Transcript_30897/m.87452 type:complete len:493 (+) Transcript_30897:757-2235(+)|eukprot:CAMPEP_0117685058 /NCGR_PEP_ID=MMETSP0804-20121206/21512_1 /TAXON_ID=1074897 /ORGANISM="Tetraselmis astigmatica, Strain CCMP880" /LENGTH=492 /DNA_ID=CAMNT_0005496255 /DNA_START=1379 /DNA_END=2857 /DNA_ORIENTATION=+
MIASIPAAVSSAMQEVDWIYVGRVAAAVVPIWLFGAIVGLLIPRPRLSSQGSRIGVMMSAYVPYLRQLVLWVHAGMIAREVWNWFKSGGTRAPASNKGSGVQSFDSLSRGLATVPEEEGDWYITRSDLDFFRDRVEKDTPVPGSGSWEMICDKRTDDLEYTSYRRGLPDGTTEYKSTTISYDATAPEFMDFFLNDPLRKEWDGMITHTEVVEDGNFAQREQVVRWLRSFPFSFMTDREYVLARRVFTVGDASYGITKSVVHPDAPTGSVIRVDDYHSMWRSRTIPSPRGNGELACETVLLHCENMKVPERLARFAVRHGMWGFVKKMGPSTRQFLNERRSRADPFEQDPGAFGHEGSSGSAPESPATPPAVAKAAIRYRKSWTGGVAAAPSEGTRSASSSARSSFSDLVSIGEDGQLVHRSGLRRIQSSGLVGGGMRRNSSARKIGALVALGVALTVGPAFRKSKSTPRLKSIAHAYPSDVDSHAEQEAGER